MTPVHRLISYVAKTNMFVINKSIIKMFLTSNSCFWLKYEFSTIAFSSKKSKNNVLWIKREMCSDQALFTSQNSSK